MCEGLAPGDAVTESGKVTGEKGEHGAALAGVEGCESVRRDGVCPGARAE